MLMSMQKGSGFPLFPRIIKVENIQIDMTKVRCVMPCDMQGFQGIKVVLQKPLISPLHSQHDHKQPIVDPASTCFILFDLGKCTFIV